MQSLVWVQTFSQLNYQGLVCYEIKSQNCMKNSLRSADGLPDRLILRNRCTSCDISKGCQYIVEVLLSTNLLNSCLGNICSDTCKNVDWQFVHQKGSQHNHLCQRLLWAVQTWQPARVCLFNGTKFINLLKYFPAELVDLRTHHRQQWTHKLNRLPYRNCRFS